MAAVVCQKSSIDSNFYQFSVTHKISLVTIAAMGKYAQNLDWRLVADRTTWMPVESKVAPRSASLFKMEVGLVISRQIPLVSRILEKISLVREISKRR